MSADNLIAVQQYISSRGTFWRVAILSASQYVEHEDEPEYFDSAAWSIFSDQGAAFRFASSLEDQETIEYGVVILSPRITINALNQDHRAY